MYEEHKMATNVNSKPVSATPNKTVTVEIKPQLVNMQPAHVTEPVTKKVIASKTITVVDIIKSFMVKGFVSIELLANDTLNECKKINLTKNKKGMDVTEERVKRQINVLIRDIGGAKGGAEKKGWRSLYQVIDYKENDKSIQKIVLRKTA